MCNESARLSRRDRVGSATSLNPIQVEAPKRVITDYNDGPENLICETDGKTRALWTYITIFLSFLSLFPRIDFDLDIIHTHSRSHSPRSAPQENRTHLPFTITMLIRNDLAKQLKEHLVFEGNNSVGWR